MAKAKFVRQVILGRRPTILVGVETRSHRCHTRNGRPMAPARFSCVLENDLQSQETSWEKVSLEGGSGG
jgi:hypothetical protein